jgi:hypothetical protein
LVQPDDARTSPEPSAADSSARTTVVPTAITRRPVALARRTACAVASGTEYHSAYGGSLVSSEDTPQCSRSVATSTPLGAIRPSTAGVSARPALGISTLPGVLAYGVRYAESGHRPVTCR